MTNERFAENPLLYIQQPAIGIPKVPMQHHYYTPKQHHKLPEQVESKLETKIVKRQTRPLRRTNFFENEEAVNDIIAETLLEDDQKQSSDSGKFKDMTLPEKITYFVDRPKHAPEIRCEVQTGDKKYQGVITGSVDDDILLRVGRRTSSSRIPLSEITGIRMLGF